MKPLRVLLADDHTLMRAGLRKLVEGIQGFQVIAEASDGRETVRLAREREPDIVLLDISMPGLNGLDATALIVKAVPATRVVVLSMHTTEGYVLAALRAGAVGYVVKDAAVDELERALRAVGNGQGWLSPVVSRHLFDDYLRLAASREDAASSAVGNELLTPRQREILQLVAEGCTTRDIAKRLCVSLRTVETHRAQLMERLNIHDVAGLTRFAIRSGLVDPFR
ncbi:response regulator transcription factor [Candidatus Accumulibacter vicinus]|uniref:Protease production enhancer protein n=1 Tax=Candidatus Accumulibacter vicinus TaxID=2954382 RepID=A0A084XV27_9PROT|nr:response regulator transcription factor [Candidatus Accumulibacter vicinus]KFB66321.1 MAG: Protease production enhancer protein [Candidatus Accumulibacter vicinus]